VTSDESGQLRRVTRHSSLVTRHSSLVTTMPFSFIEPIFLLLLLVLPAFWWFAYATRAVNIARLGPWRYGALIIVRSLALLALCLALAGTQLIRPVSRLSVVFLIDGSDSVAPAQRSAALAYLNAALQNQQPGDQAAVVLFGANALVERAPGPLASLERLSSAVIASRSNLAQAIETGLALLPADSQKRIVLLSDGIENSGRAAEAARLAALRTVPLDVVALPPERGPDVLVEQLEAPPTAREGQELSLRVRVQSATATTGQLQLFVDDELAGTQQVDLQPGTNEFQFTLPAGEAGFRSFEVRLEAVGDSEPVNNRGGGFTLVEGPPRVLLIASDASRAEPLRAALAASTIRVELRSPAQVPTDLIELRQYATIVLVDLLARDVPTPLQEALPRYVAEGGGSLAMVGGRESFGAGGWRRSPIADVLPVELDPKALDERADLALALVIDRSGSMTEATSGVSKLQLAKEAVYQASLGLERNDQIGIAVFDSEAQTVLEMQPLPDLLDIEAALGQVSEGGGTDIRSGIEQAVGMMRGADARVKHVILLTDGQAESNYADLIAQMRAEQVTITIVSIGQDANPELRQIAQIGGGAYYEVDSLGDVPRIFLAETVRVAQRDIVEQPFTPAIVLDAPPIRGLGGLPPLYGFNATEVRPAARTLLVAPETQQPILAVWQYGLGRSLAWTSDFKGQWARDWLAWAAFPRFAAGLVDALLPPRTDDNLTITARSEGDQAIFELEVRDGSGLPREGASLVGRVLGPDEVGSDLVFNQVGPGRYRAVVPAENPGVYQVQVAALSAAGQPLGAASGALVVNYSPEYAARGLNTQLLADLAALTGGRVEPPAEAVFARTNQPVGEVREISLPLLWLALLLLPLDIALRRLLLRPRDVAALGGRLRPQPRPAEAPVIDPRLARLQQARARAATRLQTDPATRGQGDKETRGQGDRGTSEEGENLPSPNAPSPDPQSPPKDTLASLVASRRKGRK
jgi:Mg-chelatase subunit ChlD